MKKQYVQPELNILVFDVKDIITLSFATSGGDATAPFDSDWIPTSSNADSSLPNKNPFIK